EGEEHSPQVADVLSEIEERPRHAPQPAESDADADALGAYLREIGRGSLLTKEQEVELAKQIEAGSEAARDRMTEANLRLVVRVADKLRDSLGRQPTDEEVGEELGLTSLEVEKLRQTSRDTVSLETPIGEEGDTELGHLIEDVTAESPANAAMRTDLKDQVDDVLRGLRPRERRVVQLRFGLTDRHQRALDEVARR